MAWKQTLKELWQKEKWYWLAAVVLGVLLSLLFAAHWTEGYASEGDWRQGGALSCAGK